MQIRVYLIRWCLQCLAFKRYIQKFLHSNLKWLLLHFLPGSYHLNKWNPSGQHLKPFGLRIADVNSLCYSSPNHDLLPNTPYLLAHRCETSACQTVTKCEQSDAVLHQWRQDPSSDSEAKLVPTPTEWLMAFPEPQYIPSLARLCEGACACGCVFVWDCRGDNQQWQEGLSCRCCCAAWSCPQQGLPVGQFKLTPLLLSPEPNSSVIPS